MFESAFLRRYRYSICVCSWLIIVLVSLPGELATSRADIIVSVPPLSSSRILASIEVGESLFEQLEAWIDFRCGCGSAQSRSGSSDTDQIEKNLVATAGSAWDLDRVFFFDWTAVASLRWACFIRMQFPKYSENSLSHAFQSGAELSPYDGIPKPILFTCRMQLRLV